MIENTPKHPHSGDWDTLPSEGGNDYFQTAAFANFSRGILSVSIVCRAENNPDEYLLSISKFPGDRCTDEEVGLVLADFGMTGATEDNGEQNGFVRNFWLPVALN